MKNTMFKSIQIQTRTGCNLKCPMCPLSKMTQPKKLMSKKLFNKILKDLDGFDGRVSLYLMNEPFLDERLREFVRLASKKLPKATINISTNGTLTNPGEILGFIEVGLSYSNVSCYTQKIYDKYSGYPGINAIDMVNYDYDYNNRGGNIDIGDGEVSGYCERPFTQMYINAFGQSILCCSDYKFEVVMGDVNDETLEQIWNGDVYKEYRYKLSNNKRHELKLCRTCNYP